MNTTPLIAKLREAQAAQQEARRRLKRNAELMELLSGGAIVFAGLILAAVFGLLTHQIPG